MAISPVMFCRAIDPIITWNYKLKHVSQKGLLRFRICEDFVFGLEKGRLKPHSNHWFQLSTQECYHLSYVHARLILILRYCYLFKLLSNPALNLMLMLDPTANFSFTWLPCLYVCRIHLVTRPIATLYHFSLLYAK